MEEFAEIYLKTLQSEDEATIIGLSGDLGSGKTTFIQIIAKLLGIKEVVTSPTFVIEKQYKTNHLIFSNLIHIDAYRLEESKELAMLGFGDQTKVKHNLIFVEWPERVIDILPPYTKYLYFTFVNEQERHIKY